MGRAKKFDYREVIAHALAAHPGGLSLDAMLAQAGFVVDRSTLFRHLSGLIDEGKVERLGKARASRYRWLGPQAADEARSQPAAPSSPVEAVAPGPDDPLEPFRSDPDIPAPDDAQLDATSTETPEHMVAINKAVRAIVREWKRYDRINLHIYLSLLAAPEHLDRLAAAVESELRGLHSGNLHKFGLTSSDLVGFAPPHERAANTR